MLIGKLARSRIPFPAGFILKIWILEAITFHHKRGSSKEQAKDLVACRVTSKLN